MKTRRGRGRRSLQDVETEEEFTLKLSPTTALRAQTDLSFATTLLNVARQGASLGQNSACLGTEQTTSSYTTPLEETFDDMSASQEQSQTEMEEEREEDSLMENKKNFRWSHEAIMLLLEEYRLRERTMSSGKISHKRAWNEIATIMTNKGYNVSGRQCMTRINTMKRAYKTIKDHNAKSGKNKRIWKYYEVMESFLSEKPYMAPLTTVSSTGSVTSKRPISPSSSNISACESDNEVHRKRKATDVMEKLIENRRLIEETKERRHKERIEMQEKLLEKLDKFIKKM